MPVPVPPHVLITGASSGLGAALAIEYASRGACLTLCGRDAGRLAGVAARCRDKGVPVTECIVDVTDAAAMAQTIIEADARKSLDIVIANAGISAGSGGGESADQAQRIFEVNLFGVLNTALPALAHMQTRRAGNIAVIASMAGFRGLPGAPAYSASKAAVIAYGDALRGLAGKEGVSISVVCPGYVRTPMTDKNDFPMPFLMGAEKAAKIIVNGIARGRKRIIFPKLLYWAMRLLNALPVCISDTIYSAMPSKRNQ